MILKRSGLFSCSVGKREAEDAIETEVVSSKKLKVEENVGEVKIDTIEVEKKVDEQCIEVYVNFISWLF